MFARLATDRMFARLATDCMFTRLATDRMFALVVQRSPVCMCCPEIACLQNGKHAICGHFLTLAQLRLSYALCCSHL